VLLKQYDSKKHWKILTLFSDETGKISTLFAMSVDEAAKRLGLKQQVVYDLVKRGFLVSIQDELFGRRVTQAGLEDFRANYISLAEYAKSLNRAPRWLLQTRPVKPISGPMIDGCRQYFFKRVDLCNRYQQAE